MKKQNVSLVRRFVQNRNKNRSEYVAELNGRAWKYFSGKFEFVRADGSSEIFYLKSSQAKLLCTIYERLGFKKVFLLEKIHESDIPKYERI